MRSPRALHVMAGMLCRPDGRVLIAERPPGKHLAGLWEFPGGKLEPGESPGDGLRRELTEELGITVRQAEPWLVLPWRYDALELHLDTWRVLDWRGRPHAREGQRLDWVDPGTLAPDRLAPADRELLRRWLAA
ncbi:MAG: (deoxy)nucleoside triphosphate pyrophosphohydrolase [Xanthomonadaceae bacterium]|nr:(deoxy)nucleoside triphosphate pyrophosphohydrolase [Xanthomonadaceae bacterium]